MHQTWTDGNNTSVQGLRMQATSAAIAAEIAALEVERHELMTEGKYGDADLALIAQTALKGAADALLAYGAGDASHPDHPFHDSYGIQDKPY